MTRDSARLLPNFYDVVSAYRADTLAVSASGPHVGVDSLCLELGLALQNGLQLSADERYPYLASALGAMPAGSGAVSTVLSPEGLARSLSEVSSNVAEQAERISAFGVATVILDLASLLVAPLNRHLYARLLAQRGRVLRKVGHLDGALEVYSKVASIGTELKDNELLGRAQIGRAAVARERGNYPAARELFHSVLEIEPDSPETRELHGLAHQGLQIAAALAHDFDAALKHGRVAFHTAPKGSERRTEILVNLASVCQMAGQYEAALNGHLSTAAMTTSDRVRLTALGGAAVAAACLSDRATVDRVVAFGAPLISENANAYACADLERAFAEAYLRLGDATRAEPLRVSALGRARSGGFFEIELEVESLLLANSGSASKQQIHLSTEALDVAAELATKQTGNLLELAIGGRQE